MITPIFNDVIVDDNITKVTEEVAYTPLVPESAPAQSAPMGDLPPQFAAEVAREEAEAAKAEAEAQMAMAQAQAQAQAQPAPIEKPVLDYDEQADLLVALSDSAQQLAFSKYAEKAYFSSEERTRIKEIKRKQRKKEELTDEEKELYDNWKLYLEFKDLLPYEDKETEMLRKPLAKVLEQMQSNFDPKTALLLAAAMVAAPRFTMLFGLRSDLNK